MLTLSEPGVSPVGTSESVGCVRGTAEAFLPAAGFVMGLCGGGPGAVCWVVLRDCLISMGTSRGVRGDPGVFRAALFCGTWSGNDQLSR